MTRRVNTKQIYSEWELVRAPYDDCIEEHLRDVNRNVKSRLNRMSPVKETKYRYLFICTQVSERKLIRMVPRFIPVPIQLCIGTGFYIIK